MANYMHPNLVLLRHGQSYTNSGRNVDHEGQNILTEKGIQDTIVNAKVFRAQFPDLHFDHTFCSPMHRAMQTGLNFLSVVDNRAIDFQIMDNFEERHFGFDGFLSIKDMIDQYGQEAVDSWDRDINAVPGDGGESLLDVYSRAVNTFESYVGPRLRAGDTVLLVAHYYVIKALQSYLDHGNPNHTFEYDPRNCVPICYTLE